MTSFEFFSVALSFVLGLGVTRLLLGGLGVFRARRRQTVHWIPIVWAVSIFLFQIQFWWALFELNGLIEIWTHGVFATLLSAAILLFISGALILPALGDQQQESLFDNFHKDGRWALLALTAYSALSIWANWFLFETSPLSATGALVVVYGGLALASFMSSNQRVLGILTVGHLIAAIYAYFALAPATY
jgi:hypothetical protein